MFGNLREVVLRLRDLTHDELINLVVELERRDPDLDSPEARERRKGKPGGLYTTEGREQRVLLDVMGLHREGRAVVRDMALMLAEALAPQPQVTLDPATAQPQARGYVEVKYIKRRRRNPDTGDVEWHDYGPYLYIRLHTSGGGKSKRERRQASIAIPGATALARAFERKEVEAAEILDAYHAGTITLLVEHYANPMTGGADAGDLSE